MESRLDRKSIDFLAAVDASGGTCRTPDIREHADLNHNEVSYRYKKLNGLGLIEIEYADAGVGDRIPPKIASLTSRGASFVRSSDFERRQMGDAGGLGGSVDEPEGVEAELRAEIETLEARVVQLEEMVGKFIVNSPDADQYEW